MGSFSILISGHYGGDDAGSVRRAITLWKQKLILPSGITDTDLVLKCNLYLSGRITRYEGSSGYSDIKMQLARGYISCAIVIQSDIWQSGNLIDFLKTNLIKITEEVASRLTSKGKYLDAVSVRKFIETLD